eukprot:gene492-8006_t
MGKKTNKKVPSTLSSPSSTPINDEKQDFQQNTKTQKKKKKLQVKREPPKISEECEKIASVFKEILQDKYDTIDLPVIYYLSDILNSQNNPLTKIQDEEVLKILNFFFVEVGVSEDEEKVKEITNKLVEELYSKELLKKVEILKSTVKVLDSAINLNRTIGDKLLDDTFIDKVSINTNDDLDWELKMTKAKAEKKRKKDEKEKKEEEKKYKNFLKLKGISENREQIVKVHNSEFVGSGSRDINVTSINMNIGKAKLLEDADLILHKGKRYGLIGRNGVGKTTLLRQIEGRELENIPPYMQILHIEQEVKADDTMAIDLILKTDIERERLLEEEKKALESTTENANDTLTKIYARMDEIDAHNAEARAATILFGLGFTNEMQKMTTKEFSGGWRMRLALARALFVEPELLMLDEPTNHLDLHAVLWLEKYLAEYKNTMIVVSHDRNFLNEVCTDIIHFNNHTLSYYKGDFYTFEKARNERLMNQQKTFEAQQKQKEHVEKFINRFRFKTAHAAMVQSRIKMLEKMTFVSAIAEDPTFTFEIESPTREKAPYIQAVDISFAYQKEKPIFNKLNFNLHAETRIALVGANGSGKSTFLKCLAGELDPTEGYINRNSKVRIAKFSQHHVDHLNLQQTPLEYMCTKFPDAGTQQMRSHLGKLGLTQDLAVQPIYTLSGGQKSRIMFAMISYLKPHILLLDEPTNHLDIDTVEALIQALQIYEGGVLFFQLKFGFVMNNLFKNMMVNSHNTNIH